MVTSAVTTKAMREAALYLTGFRRHEIYGVGLNLDPQVVIDRLRDRATEIEQMLSDSVRENLVRHHVAYVPGTATLGSDRTVIVTPPDGAEVQVLRGEAILLATGSRPFHPPDIPFGAAGVMDSDRARVVDHPLKSLVVVGGGAVACEYASIFLALGAQVTIVDRGERLLSFLDGEISALLLDSFRAFGMTVLNGTSVVGVTPDEAGPRVELSNGDRLQPEMIIFAAGRAGNTDGLGLADAGVEVDGRGRIVVDEHYQTSVPGIYAAGDVIGPPALASVSMEQGRVAACFATGITFKQTVDPMTPFGVYTIPECAMVGLTEEEAGRRGIEYVAGSSAFANNSRAAIAGSTEGAIKLVVRRDDRKLIGVHVIGEGATELVHLGQAVMNFDGTVDYFIHSTFDVPTVTDSYKYAAYACLQRLSTG